jgi:hypothetical protein
MKLLSQLERATILKIFRALLSESAFRISTIEGMPFSIFLSIFKPFAPSLYSNV